MDTNWAQKLLEHVHHNDGDAACHDNGDCDRRILSRGRPLRALLESFEKARRLVHVQH
jgi:hypothetical protein